MKTCWFHLMPYRFLPENFENDYRSVWIQRLSAMGKFVWPIPDKGLKKRLHRLSAPTLILWGDAAGANPPAYAGEFARLIRGAAARTMPGGHMLHLESPDAVTDTAVTFLSS